MTFKIKLLFLRAKSTLCHKVCVLLIFCFVFAISFVLLSISHKCIGKIRLVAFFSRNKVANKCNLTSKMKLLQCQATEVRSKLICIENFTLERCGVFLKSMANYKTLCYVKKQ
jgi:hypothetical protein